MSTIFNAFRKANAVIESCTSKEHLEGARLFLRNFIKIYSPGIPEISLEEIKENMDSLEDRSPEDVSTFMFWELYSKLLIKEKELGLSI